MGKMGEEGGRGRIPSGMIFAMEYEEPISVFGPEMDG
jgi:hypothetical protein